MTVLNPHLFPLLCKFTQLPIGRTGGLTCLVRGVSVTHRFYCHHATNACADESLPRHMEIDNRGIRLDSAEQKRVAQMRPVQPPEPRCMKVALIGTPNAGKSTLANRLLGHRFSCASNKVHTTQTSTLGVLTEGNTQLIFLDTPGMTTPEKQKKHKLKRTLLTDPHSSLFQADLIAVVCDVSNVWGCSRINAEVLKALYLHQSKKSVLILNKVDKVKKKDSLLKYARVLSQNRVDGKSHSYTKKVREKENIDWIINKIAGRLKQDASGWHNAKIDSSSGQFPDHNAPSLDPFVDAEMLEQLSDLSDADAWTRYHRLLNKAHGYTLDNVGWPLFSHVFMVSALENDGLDYLKDELLSYAPERPWQYHDSVVTDQDPVEVARLTVWEKVMDHLSNEVPYQIKVVVTMFEMDEKTGLLHTAFDLICTKPREFRSAMGRGGSKIKAIQQDARQELMNTFFTEVIVNLNIKNSKKPEQRLME